MLKWSEVKAIQSCPTLCHPMDYRPWNSPGQNTGVGSLSLFQGIFPTQGSNPGLPHCRQILYQLRQQGSPEGCCCCCQVASVVSDSVWPQRQQPTRLPRPWDSPGKNTGVACHFLLQCVKVKSESEVAQSCLTFCNPMDCSSPGSSIPGILQARVLECWNLPKKGYPVSRDKAEAIAKWSEGNNYDKIKSHTHQVGNKLENDNTKEIIPLSWRFWTPYQVSQPGDPTKGLGTPWESALEDQRIWLQDFHRTGGNRDSSLGGLNKTLPEPRLGGKEQESEPKYLLVL